MTLKLFVMPRNTIIIFCLPPHATHEAQPLDVSFFGPLKKHWGAVCHQFYQDSPGRIITKFNLNELFSRAWLKAITPENLCSGFRKAGIVPFNPQALMKLVPKDNCQSLEDKGQSPEVSQCQSVQEISDSEEEMSGESEGDTEKVLNLSPEKEELFQRRLEEGYDLPDSEYHEWLRVYHPSVCSMEDISSPSEYFPDAVVATPLDPPASPEPSLAVPAYCSPTLVVPSSSVSTVLSSASTVLAVSAPTFVSAVSTSSCIVAVSSIPAPVVVVSFVSTPVSSSISSSVSSPVVSVLSDSTNKYVNSISPLEGSTTPKSISPRLALTKHIQPVSLFQTGAQKTRKARVLTSSECLDMLEEKKRKKELELIEKENKKRIREEKKKERELLQKKKKEEQEKKKAAREKKKEEQEELRKRRKAEKENRKSAPARQNATRTDRQCPFLHVRRVVVRPLPRMHSKMALAQLVTRMVRMEFVGSVTDNLKVMGSIGCDVRVAGGSMRVVLKTFFFMKVEWKDFALFVSTSYMIIAIEFILLFRCIQFCLHSVLL